ncbi:MAG: GntP family permease [Desulfuromonadaceae bacterium]
MEIVIILLALCLLMFVAYRGFSVILFAPICALFAVLLTEPGHVLPFYSGIFMDKMVVFVKLYFPVFLLGAIFGKVIEMSGFAKSITHAIIGVVGAKRAMFAIVLVGAILTYGGVSLFVVAFAVYPFAAELFRAADIPKRLIPGTIALGAFTFTMDAFPGTPQIQNIIPTTFFKTDTWAAPWLGLIGGLYVFFAGMAYLEWRRRAAHTAGEGYGEGHTMEPEHFAADARLPSPYLAVAPLVLVGVMNKVFISLIPRYYGTSFDFAATGLKEVAKVPSVNVGQISGVWAVEGALLCGVLMVLAFSFSRIKSNFNKGINMSIAGSLLATINTASEYGFGAIISSLPGFTSVKNGVGATITNPLVNEAVTTTALAGITGSASGGMSIALAAMGQTYLEQAQKFGINPQVLHRVASMASGGMDTLPHNGAVITLLTITGLTHKQSYKDIFALTLLKTSACFLIIALYYLFDIV